VSVVRIRERKRVNRPLSSLSLHIQLISPNKSTVGARSDHSPSIGATFHLLMAPRPHQVVFRANKFSECRKLSILHLILSSFTFVFILVLFLIAWVFELIFLSWNCVFMVFFAEIDSNTLICFLESILMVKHILALWFCCSMHVF